MAVDVTVCRLLYGGCKRLVTNRLNGLYLADTNRQINTATLEKSRKSLIISTRRR